MGKIRMTVQANSHPEYGNIADFRLMLNGGFCTVNWGDGTTTTHHAEGEEQHIRHTYPEECLETEKTFVITISSDEDNITGISINDEFTYMDVKDIDISGCQSLKYFGTTSDNFDISTNPGIKAIDLVQMRCPSLNFSNSNELESLFIQSCLGGREKVQQLDLTKCNKLEYLACYCNSDLTDISVSDDSALMTLIYEMTPLSDSSLDRLRKVINRNGGEIRKLETEGSSLTKFIYDIETSATESRTEDTETKNE